MALGVRDIRLLHEPNDFFVGCARQNAGRQQRLNLRDSLIGLVGVDQAEAPKSDQQQRDQGQHQKESEARRQQAAVVPAKPGKHVHCELHQKDALNAGQSCFEKVHEFQRF